MANKYDVLKKIKPFFFYVQIVTMMTLLMMSLVYGVYLLPIYKIRENVEKSADILYRTAVKNNSDMRNVFGMKHDFATDARMLNMAAFLSSNHFQDSLLNPRMHYSKDYPIISLLISMRHTTWEKNHMQEFHKELYFSDYYNGYKDVRVDYYPRFWHGYLIFLKPLLLFFDLGDLRIFNLILQGILLLAILYLLYKKLDFRHCISFVTVMCFLNPYTSWRCLEYATDINIMMLATLGVLLKKNFDDKRLFFIIGMVTSLFDFFTFPLITLGIPLVLYILLYERSFKDSLICVIKNALLWGCGYASMLFMKWSVVTMLTDYNIIYDGWRSFLHRTTGPGENGILLPALSYANALRANFNVFFNLYTPILLAGCLLLILMRRCRFEKNMKAVTFLLIAFMPFVWYLIFINHSFIHWWMSYKILTITIYALLSALLCCLEPKTKN